MDGKKNSLMDRRKKNLSGLQSTIKNLSVIQKELNSPKRELKQAHSMGNHKEKREESEENHQNLTVKENRSRRGSCCSNVPSSEEDNKDYAFEDKYAIEAKVGEGAHGVVRKCIHKVRGKVYAVKTLQT